MMDEGEEEEGMEVKRRVVVSWVMKVSYLSSTSSLCSSSRASDTTEWRVWCPMETSTWNLYAHTHTHTNT